MFVEQQTQQLKIQTCVNVQANVTKCGKGYASEFLGIGLYRQKS